MLLTRLHPMLTISFSSPEQNQRRIPDEKGPFGKARKRGTSRAKTPTTKSAADEARLDNIRAIDDIFGRYRVDEDKKRSVRGGSAVALPPSASAPNLLDANTGMGTSFGPGASASTFVKEPKEVILYGYGNDAQWAAIAQYERISSGLIYEEYDREPQNTKFAYSFASQRSHQYGTLSKSALGKVNAFVGGEHWIKVTFDSAEAAERACHYSPKNIQGWMVYAEMYRGTGPIGGDKAIRAEVGGASPAASPNTVSSGTVGLRGTSQSSATVSSATATASIPASHGVLSRSITEPSRYRAAGAFPSHLDDFEDLDAPLAHSSQPAPYSQPHAHAPSQDLAYSTGTALNPRSARATLRLKGANVKAAVFLPQEKAFLPAPSRWQQTFSSLPIIGWVIGSGQGLIGDQVPRKEDGSFDEKSASLYWRLWYSVDSCFGTDFCGVRDAETDD